MLAHRSLCIVVLDGGRARFVRPAADRALHTEERLESPTLHARTAELVGDHAGRSFESASPVRHAIEPRSEPHMAEKTRFAAAVAAKLDAAAREGAFDALVLVAPAPILADLQDALGVEATRCVVGTLPKDLVKVPDDALQPHLSEWVRPVDRA
ncbi:MAG: host attachment protein [Rhodospirillales bacterium]|nr:host attachment protein [Rhodospirillales bacterium]